MSAPELHIEEAGAGRAVVLLHGLTASHRYVVMGSRALERSGHRVVGYDARGHGASAPAPDPAAYAYGDLLDDLERVLDSRGIENAVLAGASMGAHTALRMALEQPGRVAGLVVITPAFEPRLHLDAAVLARWDALSDGLRTRGVQGFLDAYGEPPGGPQWRERLALVLRQRLGEHQYPGAVADALRAVPRSRPFETIAELAAIDVPCVVIADRDEVDPGHPLAVGEAYAAAIPGAELVVEEPGASPVAWQGGRVSALIAGVAEAARW